jgi:hypothetical protein
VWLAAMRHHPCDLSPALDDPRLLRESYVILGACCLRFMRLRLDLRLGSGHLPACDVIASGATEGVPRDGQRIGHVRGDDGDRDGHPDIVDAPAELGRDLRRGDRRIGGIGQGRAQSPRGPLPRPASRRYAARSAAPRNASSTCWPSPSAYLS